MYCRHCGRQLLAEDRFCSSCGAAQHPATGPLAARRLVRPREGRKIAGVALGFAHYLDMDVTVVRIVLVMLTLLGCGTGLIGYIIAWILMPDEATVAVRVPTSQSLTT